MLQGRLGLDEILRRDISTDWYEGVAVIQAVCRNIPGVNVPGTGFPAPGQISVTATGEIELLGIASGINGVVAAGRLLGEMLHNDVPVRLRLIHSEAVAPNPAFGTLQELVEALAYFERPDGQQTIQKLYARAIAAPQRQGHTDHATAQPVAPAQVGAAAEFKPESQEQQAEPARKRQSNPLYAVAAGIVLVAVASTAFMSYSGEPGDSVMSGVDEAVERPEAKVTTKPAAKAAAASRSTKKGETTSTPRAGERSQPTQRLAVSRPASVTRLNTLMMPELVSLTPPPIAVPRFPAAHIFHESIEVPAAPGPERDDDGVPVYSRVNGEVRPPIAIRPHLPSEPPAYIPVEHLMVLDLVVTNKGLVESVRLLTDPRTVNDFMIVSAAKAWLFAPATLNGQPVKYRHRIRFAVP